MNECKNYFNSIADKWSLNEDYNHDELKSFLSFLPIKEGDRVLDVACGTGKISEILYELSSNDVDAIDVSDKMIEHALEKHNNPRIHFECRDFFDNQKIYDVIVIFNAYPHLMEVEKLASVAFNSLSKDGYLVIAHNLSRKELDSHHAFVPTNVSRTLGGVDSEYQNFVRYFKPIKLEDTDHSFVMVLKKS